MQIIFQAFEAGAQVTGPFCIGRIYHKISGKSGRGRILPLFGLFILSGITWGNSSGKMEECGLKLWFCLYSMESDLLYFALCRIADPEVGGNVCGSPDCCPWEVLVLDGNLVRIIRYSGIYSF